MLFPGVIVFAAAVPAAVGLTPIEQSFYPPTLDDVSFITNASLGSAGEVVQAPRRDANASFPYGTFNYCTMPHPRTAEYEMPWPVRDGSVDAKLVFLEYIQRHQRRTPYNILPGGEVCGSPLELCFQSRLGSKALSFFGSNPLLEPAFYLR